MTTKAEKVDEYASGSKVAFDEASQKVGELASEYFMKHRDEVAGVLRGLAGYFEEQARLCAEETKALKLEARKRERAGELHYWLKELFEYCPLSSRDEREAEYRKKIQALLDKIDKE